MTTSSGAELLRAAIDTLDSSRRQVRWELRRIEAAMNAALEALHLVEHTPDMSEVFTADLLESLPATSPAEPGPAVDMSKDSTDPFCTPAPAVTCDDVVANLADTPDNSPDSPPAVSVRPKRRPGQRARRSTDPNWVEVADAMRAKPDGVSMRQHLIATFGASATTVKNWPARVRALGLIADPAPTPAPAPAQTVMVRALMCQSCDYHVLMYAPHPAVTMSRHVRAVHGRIDLRPSERTPTDVPVDVPAESGVA